VTMTRDHFPVPPPELWRKHEEAHRALWLEQQSKRDEGVLSEEEEADFLAELRAMKLYDKLRRKNQAQQFKLKKRKSRAGRKPLNDGEQVRKVAEIIANSKLKGERLHRKLRDAGIKGKRSTMYALIDAARNLQK
jgi:hypothetical protein